MRRRLLRIELLVAVSWTFLSEATEESPRYTDVTKEAGIKFIHSFGDNKLDNIVETTGAGCAFFDYNNDGFLDIYLVSGCYHPVVSHPSGRHLAGKLRNALWIYSRLSSLSGAGKSPR